MRNLWDVVEQLIEALPANAQNRDAFVQSARHVAMSARYTAPEIMYTRWNEITALLVRYYNDPDSDEHKRLIPIFNNCST